MTNGRGMGARFIATLVAVLVFAAALGAGAARADTLRARLSGDVVPVAYDLTVAADAAARTTSGSEVVDVVVRRPVDALALNAHGLVVSRAVVDGRPARVEEQPTIEQLRLRTVQRLRPGPHRVELAFSGTLRDAGHPGGLFSADGASVASMFEPSTARTLFPCFDEPQFRARFTLHVRAPVAWTVVSNMPLRARRELGDGRAQSDFEPTPPMPVYLLTIDGGVFAHADGRAGSLPIRVFVRPGQEEHARAILADTQRLLPFYESFFGVPFPLPKLDVVVMPGFLQDALEGWGAITAYSEDGPFGTQFGGGAHGRRFAAELLAHEMAHQWAGDLVTMRWWRDTFVAEGVAEFSQREAVRAVFPELMSWLDDDAAVFAVMRHGVSRDSLPALNPIATDLEADDWQVFAGATYDKGATVVAAWRDTVGAASFHAGLTRYLHRHAYGSATFEDFWSALSGAEGVAYGHSWLAQRGFPILDVRSSCSGGATSVALTQTPYSADPRIGAGYRAQRWIVPVTIRTGGQERRVLLRERGATVRLNGCAPVAIDPDDRPYQLLRYDDATYAGLAQGAAQLGRRERERLYRDASLLHSAGELPAATYLRLLTNTAEPMSDDVWLALINEELALNRTIRGSPEAAALYALERRSLQPLAARPRAASAPPTRLEAAAALVLAAGGAAGSPEPLPTGASFEKQQAERRALERALRALSP